MSFDAHFAVSRPGTLTHGVSIGFSGVTHGFAGAAAVIVRPLRSRYACSSPLPPPSAAGLVQAASMAASGTLPNSVLAGGGMVERNDANVITHPVCDAERQSGTCWNEPPTSFPFGTPMVVPSRIAETIRDWIGLPSISLRISSARMNDPCEWADEHEAASLVVVLQVVVERVTHVVVLQAAARGTRRRRRRPACGGARRA